MHLFHLLVSLRLAHPAARIAVTLMSVALFAALYAWVFDWGLALGLTVVLCIHEAGHLTAARWRRIPMDLPIFLPFIGAFVLYFPQQEGGDPRTGPRVDDGAFIAIGGPALGTVAAAVCWALAAPLGSETLTLVALLGMWLNLFNLIPMAPLDGGQIIGALSPALMWTLGLPALAGAAYHLPWQAAAVLLLLTVPTLVSGLLSGYEPSHTAPAPRIDSRMRWAYGVVYAALVATTAAGVALIKV
jgi:Zn-dependent protease